MLINPPDNYMIKLTIETLEKGMKYGAFTINFEHISHLALVFLLLTLNRKMFDGNWWNSSSWMLELLIQVNSPRNYRQQKAIAFDIAI